MTLDMDLGARPCDEDTAKKVIDRIRRNRGYIDEADEVELRKTTQEFQDEYRRKEEERRRILANYTKTTSDQMYLSKSRFIYELVQNADDAEYAPGVAPCLTFRIRQDELIVDSNELGFTRANVESICSTGESSKKKNVKTTGEKGLGFKSVFGISHKVHIQSGNWSFRFEHRRGDDGLGMVTPLWTPPSSEPLPPGVNTRFRLTFADSSEKAVTRLVKEFDSLPDVMVFALRRISKVEIVCEAVFGRADERSVAKLGTLSDGEVSISSHKKSSDGVVDPVSRKETTIRTVSHTVDSLPEDDLRKGPSTITLGFQVNPNTGLPVIPTRGQHVFAFLPVQRLIQLPFLVQADFVLGANREGIPEGDWNDALRSGIVDTYSTAIQRFCRKQDPLFYTWMKYLPTSSAEDFWYDFHEDIYDAVMLLQILETRTLRVLKSPSVLRILPSTMIFEGQPLLPDILREDVYLSEKYQAEDLPTLKNLGLKQLSAQETIRRLRADLDSSNSRTRRTALDNDWHTALTTLIDNLMQKGCRSDLVRLKIIPLTTSEWVAPECTTGISVYLPLAIDETQFQVKIPGSLGLQLLNQTACAVSERLSVYISLGVSSCPDKILQAQVLAAQTQRKQGITLLDYISHFHILFWLGYKQPFGGFQFFAVDENNKVQNCRQLFVRTQGTYEAHGLLDGLSIRDVAGYYFLDQRYTNKIPLERIPMRNGKTWMSWLHEVAGVRSFPTLLDASRQLHPLLKLVAQNDSTRFLGCLHHRWEDTYRWESYSLIQEELRRLSVRCQSGSRHSMQKTILPLEKLLLRSRELDIYSAMPFLTLPDGAFSRGEESWTFLKEFGVTCEENLGFHFEELDAIKREYTRRGSHHQDWCFESCIKVYKAILTTAKFKDSEMVKTKFRDTAGIFIPGSAQSWYEPADCLWKGPALVQRKPVLENIFNNHPEIEQLFSSFLGVPDATFYNVLDEILLVKQRGNPSETLLTPHYRVLSDMSLAADLKGSMRDAFERYVCIYAEGQWLRLSQTIWKSEVNLVGRTAIGHLYPTLERFFRKDLGIVTMDIALLLKEIIKASKSTDVPLAFKRIKELMIIAGQIILEKPITKEVELCIAELKDRNFLPCKQGASESLESRRSEFFLVDNERYGSAFENKLKFLDFSFSDMTYVYPLLQKLDLLGASLSAHVTVDITVDEFSENPVLTSYIGQRAYALSCCAISYHSPEYFNQSDKMHSLLMGAKVLCCEKMIANLHVLANNNDIVAQSDRPLLKLERSDEGLRIYVPSRDADFHACFRTGLPKDLANLLQIEDGRATKQLYRIINDESMGLDAIMSEEDIPTVSWLEKPVAEPVPSAALPVVVDNASISSSLQTTLLTPPDSEENSVETRFRHSRSRSAAEVLETLPTDGSPQRIFQPSRSAFSSSSNSILQGVAYDRQYRRLLERIIRQARGLAQDPFSMADLADALEDEHSLRRALGLDNNRALTFEENAKIGAAGELFVFERLRAFGLPGFGLDNWTSTIRNRVNVVPDYHGLGPAPPPERADLVFVDITGRTEEFFRANSSSTPFPEWAPFTVNKLHHVEYLIEVKTTTTRQCSTPFFMSNNQYNRMRECHGADGHRPPVVYVICRVYDLLGDHVKMEVFVDPWRRRDHELEFVCEGWKGIPNVGF